MNRETSFRLSRRTFLGAAATGPAIAGAVSFERPALLGGKPVRTEPFPGWPVRDEEEDRAILEVVHGGKWGRGNGQTVARFEASYARLMNAQHALATSNG